MTGTTLTALALDHGLPESACRIALAHSYQAAELAIAECIGVPVQELFPSRFLDNGERRYPRRFTRNSACPRRKAHVKKDGRGELRHRPYEGAR